jgi:flagellar biosynthetic protein FliQ
VSGDFVLYLARRTMETAMLLAAPVLVVTLVVGFLVAMMQAVTSIRDMTLGLVVKLAAVAITLMIAGGWMMQVAVGFTSDVFAYIQMIGKS